MARRKPQPFTSDPLWYKDAVIYQLHVKSFFDSDNDGVGDFPGLIAKLDYLAEIGVNAVWLLPFYPSPRRDDGYDIAEYRAVHPEYGTLRDVRHFIHEAHRRGIRVITELVVNHTSDQHPWFQRARRAKPGSAARNFYVWSDDDKKYSGTRIIFIDTEKSNWTWDEEAKAYYWHRFYSHQPDLNFDNPQVLKAVLGVMRFWLDMGVDGLRLDAVPYLVEREGTTNENLPETHAVLKTIRKVIDQNYPDRMLLAEANQWPEDIQEYFGNGDECQMVFHFPLMPRMYMAIAQEDRFPITDIIRQTPDIPDNCQWAIFLRNHDELTLEMVTDKERDYLWDVYASDRRARLNLGIRRRLAPLMERDRRRIELMNVLLFTMPGTPIIYYGDEIGMGDNIHLGDRDGVRTPMQWSSDRNGGFSRADPPSLVSPPLMDPLYGYQAVNVEAQWRDPHSLLNWLRRMLVVRGRHKAFGRGTMRFLLPQNRKVLAYLREFEDETILCVVNVARTAQAVELDLSEFSGRVPVELLGGSSFPRIGQLTYLLTLPPYGFYWFVLSETEEGPSWSTSTGATTAELHTFVLRQALPEIVEGKERAVLERDNLPAYVSQRRWYQSKGAGLPSVRVRTITPFPPGERDLVVAELEVGTAERSDRYFFPMSVAWEDVEGAGPFEVPLAFARVRRGGRIGLLTDGFTTPRFARAMLASLAKGERLAFGDGELHFDPAEGAEIPEQGDIEWPSMEQSNSSLVVGREVVLKLFRKATPGVHPEAEMTRVLTERGFGGIAALIGEVTRVEPDGSPAAFAIVQRYVHNQGDGFRWTVDQLDRIVDERSVAPEETPNAFEAYGAFAQVLGRRVGEMHAVLAEPSHLEDFAPEIAGPEARAEMGDRLRRQIETALAAADREAVADAAHREAADALHARAPQVLQHARTVLDAAGDLLLTRIHGDLHLGQVLVASGDVVIIDFEGEPTRPLAERRAKTSPLRDVAGMLRSFDYAAGLIERSGKLAEGSVGEGRAHDLLAEFRRAAEEAFLDGYVEGRGASLSDLDHRLIALFALEKAAYEIAYEADNRPSWLGLPLHGFLALAERLEGDVASHG